MIAAPNASSEEPSRRWSSAVFALSTASGAWLLYLAVVILRCIVYGFKHPTMLIERHALTALVAIGMAALLYLLLSRIENAPMRRRLAAALLGAAPPALLLSFINYNVMYVFVPQAFRDAMGVDVHLSLLGEVLSSAIENYFVFAAWAALYTAVSHAVQTQDLLRRAATSEAAARSAELRALRYQLDPHFLFNALNTVSGLMLSGDVPGADRTIEALSSFLRATLAVDASADISLTDELQLQQLYLQIEQVRFGDRLAVEVSVPEPLGNAMVPALLLQPIVENSIRHAVARSTKPVHIAVAAQVTGETLVITVANDGPDGRATGGHGLGLANVSSRLALRYDGKAGCEYRQSSDGGFVTRITLPLRFGQPSRALAA
ncbi:sensor histidine kinase [Glacieibacterium megasporae]|uniref:sensor histidine kinase n=1 Tax=Glacieibacterium megasporae TaxID=2835787 RepID=UPI001C1DE083|nr:histidine kinase [Polymorphobacter megasporae]UAJ08932.1 histidine kinase [Polymorphobacter megasporae]